MSNSSIRLFFAGDFCSKPSASAIVVSEELHSIIESCDISVVNFEVPLRPNGIELPPQNRERFFQNDDVPGFLADLGFDLFSLANNHIFDWGEPGFLKTKEALGNASFGAGTYDDAYQVKIVEISGVKIGFLAVCFAAYTGVFDDVTQHDGLGCAYINDFRVNHVILDAKKDVDYLFILPHDGIEYIDIPMPKTIARYRDFIDYGADGVIGTHPHCPQGWESYRGKPIFYSLGNFLFNSKNRYDYRAVNRPHWYEGLCVVISIACNRISWDIINTRNVDNTSIIVEHNAEREKHNEQICRYLNNIEEYNFYLAQICNSLGKNELSIIDKTFHSDDLLACTKSLLKSWLNRMRGKKVPSDYPLLRLLSHDTRLDMLVQTLRIQNQ